MQRLRQGTAGRLQPWLAAKRQRLRRSDAFPGPRMAIAASPMIVAAMAARRQNGNDLDTDTNDLAELVQKLELKNAIQVGHSTGSGEVAR